MRNTFWLAFALLFSLFLFSCETKKISYNYPDNPDYVRQSRRGMLFSDKDLVAYGRKNELPKEERNGKLSKSALWKSATEIVSTIFPIAILDSDSGIIVTEWHQDSPNSSVRTKLNVLVKGNEPIKENLRITVFHQKKSAKKSGEWEEKTSEDSDSGALSAKLLQEKILELAKKE